MFEWLSFKTPTVNGLPLFWHLICTAMTWFIRIYYWFLFTAIFFDTFAVGLFFLQSSFRVFWLDKNQIRHPMVRLTNYLTPIQNASVQLVCMYVCYWGDPYAMVCCQHYQETLFKILVAVNKLTLSVCI